MRYVLLCLLLSGCLPSGLDTVTQAIAPTTQASKPVNPYPANFRLSFLESCSSGGAATAAQCGCMLEGIQREYTYDVFVAGIAPKMADGTAANDPKFAEIANRCKR